jgi:hypothetical protein
MKIVSKNRMPHHRDRAEVLFRTLLLVADDPSYSAAIPLLAVHTAISLADAILIGCFGRRGKDTNHRESLDSLALLCRERKRDLSGLKHLIWLLARKSDLVYGDRDLNRDSDVKAAFLHAERFVAWAYATFPEIARAEPIGVRQ